MADQNGKNWAERWWPYLLIAMLGGTGGAGFKDVLMPPRPDPYRGDQAKQMDARHMLAVNKLETRVDRIEIRLLAMMDKIGRLPPHDLLQRVTIVEEAIKDLERTRAAKRYPE